MTTTSIDLPAVDAHIINSDTIAGQLEAALTPIQTLEATVIAGCPGRAQPPAIPPLLTMIEPWRANAALLRTIHDAVAAIGLNAAGFVPTHQLRNAIIAANAATGTLPTGTEYTIEDDGITFTVDAGSGDDDIEIRTDGSGGLVVTINGERVTLTPEQVSRLVVDGSTGDDTIEVTNMTVIGPGGATTIETAEAFTIHGGSGDDVILGGLGNETIDGGAGHDYLDGGRGDDLLFGGSGNDVVYGGWGADTIEGEAGNDYLDGGLGADTVNGGFGDDLVFGGRHADTLDGGFGDDVIIGGLGPDTISDLSQADVDTIWSTPADTVDVDANDNVEEFAINAGLGSSALTVQGDDRFTDRVMADLDLMRSIPEGAAVLASLDAASRNADGTERNTTTIRTTNGGNQAAPDVWADSWRNADGTSNDGTDGVVSYNTDRISIGDAEPWQDRPPIVGLYHELLHAEDFVNGTLDRGYTEAIDINGNPLVDSAGNPEIGRNLELSVVGQPYDDDNEDNNDANASPAADADPNTRANTENTFRDQLGLVPRDNY